MGVPTQMPDQITQQKADQMVAQLPQQMAFTAPGHGQMISKPMVDEMCAPSSAVASEVQPGTSSRWTCRMIRNIPNDYTRDDVQNLLDAKGVQYYFLYVPIDWKKSSNLGYAFVNLIS